MASANVVQTSVAGGNQNALALQGDGVFFPKVSTASRLALGLTTSDTGFVVYDTQVGNLFFWTGTAWVGVPTSGSPGLNQQVQYNNNGVVQGATGFTFDNVTNAVAMGASATITGDLTVRTNKLFVNATGVGVGTTNVLGDFTIQNGSNCRFEVTSSAGGTVIENLNNARNAYLNMTMYADAYIWNRLGTTAMTLNATGLGVGAVPSGNNQFTLRSSGAGTEMTVSLGRASAEGIIGIAAGTNGFVNGSVAGDMVVRSIGKLMLFNNGANAGITIDTAANVGIGVAPSAINVGRGLEVGAVGNGLWCNNSSYNQLLQNAYNTSISATGWRYAAAASTPAVRVQLGGGEFNVYNAVAGTAGTDLTWTPRLTLDASGNLLVGTTSLIAGSASGSLNIVGANTQQIQIRNSSATAGQYWRQAVDSSNTIYILNNASTGVSITSGATSWSAVSDERLKDIIEPIGNAVAKVGSLRSVIGKYKSDSEGTRRSFLIAQDVQSVLPEAVDTTNADAFGVRYSEVIPLLVAAIKELTTRVQTLEAK